MSFIHRIVYKSIEKGKCRYNPEYPPDYAAKRLEEEKQTSFYKLPKSIHVKKTIFKGVAIEFLVKKSNPKNKMIFYIHGGGFITGSAKSRRMFTGYLVDKCGINVAAIDYRLAPEHKFPAALEDCILAYKILVRKYGGKNIVLVGESAGGSLVLSTILLAMNEKLELPAGVVAISPKTQYQFSRSWKSYLENERTDCIITNIDDEITDMYFQSKDKKVLENPLASPYFGDYHGFPPTFLNTSTTELLRDDTLYLYKKMKKAGTQVELQTRKGMLHAYLALPILPEAKKDLKRVCRFIIEQINK